LRYSASLEINQQDRFIACWVERAGLHAWLIGEDGVENELRYPSHEYSSIADALASLIDGRDSVHWIYVGGDVELLARAGASTGMVKGLFGYPVMPFECAPFCNGAQRVCAVKRRRFPAGVSPAGNRSSRKQPEQSWR
jgi:hypothetical protein